MTQPAATERTSRRALLGAGVLGAALAAAVSRSVAAAPLVSGQEAPGLSAADTDLARFAMQLELTARDLYDAAIADGAGNPVWATIREHHEAYATRLAGLAGLSADTRIDAVYDALVGEFDGSPATAALDLENAAAATHAELLGLVVDDDVAAAMASIGSMEARHALVAAQLAERTDFDSLFLNPATPLSPEA